MYKEIINPKACFPPCYFKAVLHPHVVDLLHGNCLYLHAFCLSMKQKILKIFLESSYEWNCIRFYEQVTMFYRLMNVEDELRHDQEEMQSVVKQKQKVIEAQERRIKTLDNANAKLMSALHQLRSVSQTNNNSMLGPLRTNLISPEVAEFKTSSC